METPLTPLDFARRAVKLYAEREAVVDGPLRFTYAQFCERCNRWGAGLASLGVEKGDRVATISPNTHQHLEQFYAIPRGALAHFKVPTAFHFLSELPKTATGKIQKFVLRGKRPGIARQ